MERKLVGLRDEQWRRLRALSAKTGAPLSELIRRAVQEYLERHKG